MNYLSSQEILFIHHRLLSELNEPTDNIDVVGLKKLTKYIHNTEIFPDKLSKASALLFGIARKKVFEKRSLETAISVMALFLEVNKTKLEINSDEFRDFIKNDFPKSKIEDIRSFLLKNTR